MNNFQGRLALTAIRAARQAASFRAKSMAASQLSCLTDLLSKASKTAIGRKYDFRAILASDDPLERFRERVPVHSYSRMRDEWWSRCQRGEINITWPGSTPYFSMSSGTSDATSKFLPVTHDMIASVKKVGQKQIFSLADFDLPVKTFSKEVLMLGSSTSLLPHNGHLQGDMSGISTKHLPRWMTRLYLRPQGSITNIRSWNDRIDAIVQEAHNWHIGILCGVPSWVAMLLKRIIVHNKAEHIHQVWPDLSLYIHGGVPFDQYESQFRLLFGKEVTRMETYMASEGSFGFQHAPGTGIRLVGDAGIFYEFIPFTSRNFNEHGELQGTPHTYALAEVRGGVDYAIVLSSCAGAWRYILGDVVRFTDPATSELKIIGRTRQFLDLCGEHVSLENVTRTALESVRFHGIASSEFCVGGERTADGVRHTWYIGCDCEYVNAGDLAVTIDKVLCELNDDYRVARQALVTDPRVVLVPDKFFYNYMSSVGQEGAMSKFPRVLKGERLFQWQKFIEMAESQAMGI